ncbi:MAG: M6 family metalloprotease domain-containing protein [Fibrobacteres bacterium]|nr:M6 family metalloprotease domain-containing protein [Fibrobacterota bacterium]
MTPITLLGLLFASQVPPDFIPVDWRNLPVRKLQGPVAARAAAPVTKVLKILVVPMRYADQDSTYSSDTLSRVFSGPYPYVTVNQYFAEQSGGQFQVDAKVIGWQKLSLTKAQALALPERTRQIRFRNEAAAAASQAGVKLSDYDFNGDGRMDGLMIMYAGKSSQESRISTDLGNAVVTQSSLYDTTIGVLTVRQNVFISEVRNDRPSNSGPIAHELSHVIGASDTYDADTTLYGKSGGLGYWDLMSSGSHGLGYNSAYPNRQGAFKPTGMSTWVKDDLGFISPAWIDSPQEIRLKPGQAAKVWTDPYRSRQFLLLENRSRSGVDSILPGPGLFVTRVRTARMLELNNGIAYAINDDPTDMGVEILEASGEQRIGQHAGYTPYLKDLFSGSVDSLTDRGPVSLALPDGTPSEASLKRIRMDGADILVQVTPSPKRGYALSSRAGKVTTPPIGPSNAQFVYGFRCPTSGAVVAARLALPQDAGPSNLQIWKTFASIQSEGTPLFSKALKASQSNGSQYYWADVPNPILVNEGDTIFVSQKLGTDSLSRLYAKNYDAPPSNNPCWRFVPGYATSKDPSYCPVVDLVIEHEGGSSLLRSVASAQGFRAKMNGPEVSITGAGPGEIIQAQMRDLRGSLTWRGSVVCDASGNGQLRLDRASKGLRILEVRGGSGSQVLTEMVP